MFGLFVSLMTGKVWLHSYHDEFQRVTYEKHEWQLLRSLRILQRAQTEKTSGLIGRDTQKGNSEGDKLAMQTFFIKIKFRILVMLKF